ncbi:hypothetical protein GSI_05149 [Ganoderma sinense ZZ0214-1]|uniref:Fungal-type protein kinase domain-containing protein n=1 Tax=Ganoderma sinense ZZ0214-1 TaxID=1077348 RepID=A0A2G8SFG9_9APHY|nr:hypothetical protein GSI_05149 [Ganoderma sinense ZZ0214-1]
MSGPVIDSDTPLSKGRASGYQARSLGTAEEGRANLDQYRAQLAHDMAHTAVLAELKQFRDTYFPGDPNNPRPVMKNPFKRLKKLKKLKGNEAAIRTAFTEAVTANNLIPGLVFRDCGNRPAGLHTDAYRQKVDAAWYYPRDAPEDGKPEWGGQVIPVEFKADETGGDPYDEEDEDNICADADTRKKARGQMTTYSEVLHGVQQRTAVFMLIIISRRARFTRWDRSGTVVTKAINYVSQWGLFCDTLWRIGQCSQTQLGFDPTATRVYDDDADYATMFNAAYNRNTVDHMERPLNSAVLPSGEFEYVRQMFEDTLAPGWPRYRVKVPVEVPDESKPESEKKYRDFLIGKPAFRAKGMVGRGTRGYVALDCETKKFRWLKDAWRSDYELVEREGEILAALNKADVPNVPTMFCHGDIGGQKTETPDWWELRNGLSDGSEASTVSGVSDSEHTLVDPSSSKGKKRQREDDDKESGVEVDSCPLRLHQHYRLVVEEVAMPLDRFEYPQQLVQVVFDCVLAHEKAANMPERPLLHRDISSGNILMYPRVSKDVDGEFSLTWRGILADWELSKPFQKDESQIRTSRQPVRTGTWQYLSVALLSPGPIRVGIADEVESFFHVLLYYALRYIKTANCGGLSVANFLDRYFDLYSFENNMYTCGDTKRMAIKQGEICVGSTNIPIRFENPLDNLFDQMLSWFKARYIVQAYEDQTEAAKKQQSALSARTATGSSKKKKPLAEMFSALAGRPTIQLLPKTAKPPSEEERTSAQNVKSHHGTLLALAAALCDDWPEQKAEDQIPSGWKPMAAHFPEEPSAAVENRRKCLKTPASAPVFPVASRPPKTPKKRKVRSVPVGVGRKDESP